MEPRVADLHQIRSTLHAEYEHLWQLLARVRHAQGAAGLSSLVRYLAVHETAKEVTLQILGLRLHTLRSCRPRDRDKFVAGVPAPGAGAPSCQGERHAAK